MILVDTNVLVYAVNIDAPRHESSRALVEAVQAKRMHCVLAPQVLLEFFAIITDPRRVAKPLEPQAAREQVRLLGAIFPVLDRCRQALDYFQEALAEKNVTGGDVFDAFLVARMRAGGIASICTYNVKDFAGYKGIEARTPEAFLK